MTFVATHSHLHYFVGVNRVAKRQYPGQSKAIILEGPAQTLICAFRWWLTGERDRDPTATNRARTELENLVGPTQAEVVLALFDVMIRAVARYPARTIHYHPPWCHAASPDEALLLALTGACQCGEIVWGKTLAGLITTADGEAMVLDAANELAQVLLAAGVAFPLCAPSTANVSLQTLGVVTVH